MDTYTPWYATKKFINGAIIAGIIIVALTIIFAWIGSVNNKYVDLDQKTQFSKSNISKEEQRRVDLFNNLVDAVQSAQTFEQSTLTQIAQARGQANGGNVEQAALTLSAVVEAYPNIKSTDLYQSTMLEFSATENRLAQYRETYNTQAREFNSYVQGFPNGVYLSILGKDKTQKPYLDFKVNNAEARNLFK